MNFLSGKSVFRPIFMREKRGSLFIIFFLFLFSLMACKDSLASSDLSLSDQEKAQKQIIESYLDQTFNNNPKKVIQRYESKKMKVALAITNISGTAEERAEYLKAFYDNVSLYNRLTNPHIKYVPEGKGLFLTMIIHDGPVSDVAEHEMFRESAFFNKKGKALEQAKTKLRKLNPMNEQNTKTSLRTREIVSSLAIINAKHSNINSKNIGHSTVVGQINEMWFKAFARVINLKNLPSIESVPRKYKHLQPIDIAYLKSLYDEQLHSGMPYQQAKPILMRLMQQNLQQSLTN